MAQHPGMVSTTYARLLYEYLERHGADAATVLGAPAPPAGPTAPRGLPMSRWAELLTRAARHLDDNLLDLNLGQTITPAHLGVVGYVLLACSNLGQALARFEQFMRLVYDAEPVQLQGQGDSLQLSWGVEYGRPGQLVDGVAIVSLVQFARDITATAWQPERVDFVNPVPPQQHDYEAFFGCPVRFDQDATRVRFRSADIQLPLRNPDPALLAILENQAEQMLKQVPEADLFELDLRRAISHCLHDAAPTLAAVADRLHISGRTLQRRLKARGLLFQSLLDDTRLRLARDYLADPGLKLTEVALLLGYAEQSAFNHAFKRWTGETPTAARQSAGGALAAPTAPSIRPSGRNSS